MSTHELHETVKKVLVMVAQLPRENRARALRQLAAVLEAFDDGRVPDGCEIRITGEDQNN